MIGGMEAALKRPSSCEPVLLTVCHLRKYAGREYEDEQLWPFCILVKPTYPSEDRGDGASLEPCENKILGTDNQMVIINRGIFCEWLM